MKLTCEFDRAQYLTGQEIRLYLPEGVNVYTGWKRPLTAPCAKADGR